jgi:outer membrane cobalamin receptor
MKIKSFVVIGLLGTGFTAHAEDPEKHLTVAHEEHESIEVLGSKSSLIGESISASQGIVGQESISSRPILRAGEILEAVPGMVVTQHSGSGKANQYFLRGFNLDHGTDFATWIDGMPVNMKSHGHGQGYTDLSFIVPEWIKYIDYRKGGYYAEIGDFSAAGAAHFQIIDSVDQSSVKLTLGENNYFRTELHGASEISEGQLIWGLERNTYDGPWTDISEDLNKTNAMLRYVQKEADTQFSITFLGYDNRWNSADQIPQRAVENGVIDELGSLDKGLGGQSSRYSLSTQWRNDDWQASAYMLTSNLDLFSNFTYFASFADRGDQFKQVDQRDIYGASVTRFFSSNAFGKHVEQKIGADVRFDAIDKVGLYNTENNHVFATVREDDIEQLATSAFWSAHLHINQYFTTYLAARYDLHNAKVNSDNDANSGEHSEGQTSLKAGATYQLSDTVEIYANVGQGYHSNDARGTTIDVDPVSGERVDSVPFIVPSLGQEMGLRYSVPESLNLSIALWHLTLDSELVFVGDAGNTEATRASERSGVEFSLYYWLGKEVSADIELAWTDAEFSESEEGEGNHIDGSLPFVGSIGVNYQYNDAWQAALRYRYFGERTLDSFAKQKSPEFHVVNAALSRDFDHWQLSIELLNVFDQDAHDIGYYYESQLSNELAPVEDYHYHPIEPRTLRATVQYQF